MQKKRVRLRIAAPRGRRPARPRMTAKLHTAACVRMPFPATAN